MIPSRKCIWRTGNFSKMDIISIPSTILHRHFLLLPIRERYEDRRTKTVPSSTSNLWMPHQHEILLASSWATRCAYLEALRNPGYFSLLGKFGGTIASSKAQVQFHTPKTAQSLSRTSETAVSRRRDSFRL